MIELRYQNQILREENRSLKDKLEKEYEFMKQFVIGRINLLEKFMECIGEKVKDVGRGRRKAKSRYCENSGSYYLMVFKNSCSNWFDNSIKLTVSHKHSRCS